MDIINLTKPWLDTLYSLDSLKIVILILSFFSQTFKSGYKSNNYLALNNMYLDIITIFKLMRVLKYGLGL